MAGELKLLAEATNQQLINDLELEITKKTNHDIEFTALHNNRYVGSVSLYIPSEVDPSYDSYDENDDEWKIDLVEVVPAYRRNGIAAWLYDQVVNHFGFLPETGSYLTTDGKNFRKKYIKDMKKRIRTDGFKF